MKIAIILGSYEVEATLFSTPTGKAIYDALPLESNANTWGDEIYFGIPVHVDLEADARAETALGDLAYWPTMPAFCIFFGRTPASTDDTPMAASEVNVFGKLDAIDTDRLREIPPGASITVRQLGH